MKWLDKLAPTAIIFLALLDPVIAQCTQNAIPVELYMYYHRKSKLHSRLTVVYTCLCRLTDHPCCGRSSRPCHPCFAHLHTAIIRPCPITSKHQNLSASSRFFPSCHSIVRFSLTIYAESATSYAPRQWWLPRRRRYESIPPPGPHTPRWTSPVRHWVNRGYLPAPRAHYHPW